MHTYRAGAADARLHRQSETMRNGKIRCFATPPGSALAMLKPIYTVSRAPQLVAIAESVPEAARRPPAASRSDAGTLPRRRDRYRRGRWPQLAGGLLSILERLHRGDKLDVVVAHRDRLARFGFELRVVGRQNGGAVLVLNQSDASPESELMRIYSPSSIRSVAGCNPLPSSMRRLRAYPNARQKVQIVTWLDASRWVYNLTVEVLQSGIPAAWRHMPMVMAELKVLKPEWESVPYQVPRHGGAGRLPGHEQHPTFNRQLAADRPWANG